jgi:ATPase subunit of ABC transporter with duplicated ATPase domains
MSTLAAGYKLRVLIAQVLFSRPDVLLLDEPTNHLDLDSIRWLERFLIGLQGHARRRLARPALPELVATHIADVDYQTITVYTGNYDDFVAPSTRTAARRGAERAAKKKIAELQEFVDRFGSHASKSKQAQSRVKQIEKLEVETKGAEALEPRPPLHPLRVREAERPRRPAHGGGRQGVRQEDEEGHLRGLSLNLNRGDKLAVIGANGIGKSTLLKLMVGAFAGLDEETKKETLQPDKGRSAGGTTRASATSRRTTTRRSARRTRGRRVPVALRVRQEGAAGEIRGILGRLLFSGEAALKPTEALSGGECARLLLASSSGKHNVLVLDEPTNHLDIESIEGLLDGLKLFKGTVIVVSHDRHFVSELATRVVELAPGDVIDFGGTYEEHLERHARVTASRLHAASRRVHGDVEAHVRVFRCGYAVVRRARSALGTATRQGDHGRRDLAELEEVHGVAGSVVDERLGPRRRTAIFQESIVSSVSQPLPSLAVGSLSAGATHVS